MVELAEGAMPNMVGFNYIRTPASRFAHDLIQAGEIGEITWFHVNIPRIFCPIPICQKTGDARDGHGNMGDLAPTPSMPPCA